MQKGMPLSPESRLKLRLTRLEKSMPPEEFVQFLAADGALKWCPKCKELLPVSEFHKQKRAWDGLQSWCKACGAAVRSVIHRRLREDPGYVEQRRQHSADWWAAVKADGRAYEVAKQYHLKKYGLTPERFTAMLVAQRYRCAICRHPLTGARDTHVDHDHACCPGGRSCGKCVRGLLCSDCNNGLGRFRDDPAALRRAARYLEQGRRPQALAASTDNHGQDVLWDRELAS